LTVLNAAGFLTASISQAYDKLTFTFASNSTPSRRTGIVYIIGCKTDTIVVIQESAVSVHDLSCPGLTIYPNPSKDGRFFISIPCLEEKSMITIQDLSGKILYKGWLREKREEVKFIHQRGFYILRVFNREKCYTFKILIS